jgi:hypothetical protein
LPKSDCGYIGKVGLLKNPNLKHIYLYTENPDYICFDMFNGCDILKEVTLHVPRFCKKTYEDYEVSWRNGKRLKSYLRFHHIEEFDTEKPLCPE